MKDMQASLKRLRADAAETAPKRDLATDTQSESCHQTGGSLSKRAKNNRIVSLTHRIEAACRATSLFFDTGFTSTLIHALLYSVRLFGRTGVIGPGCGICAGSAGITAR
jgi:hypothetical protein